MDRYTALLGLGLAGCGVTHHSPSPLIKRPSEEVVLSNSQGVEEVKAIMEEFLEAPQLKPKELGDDPQLKTDCHRREKSITREGETNPPDSDKIWGTGWFYVEYGSDTPQSFHLYGVLPEEGWISVGIWPSIDTKGVNTVMVSLRENKNMPESSAIEEMTGKNDRILIEEESSLSKSQVLDLLGVNAVIQRVKEVCQANRD